MALLQYSLLSLFIFTVTVAATAPPPSRHNHHHHHLSPAPAPAPAKAPSTHHSHAPTPAPAKAPTTHHSIAPSTKTPAKPPAPAPAYHRIPRKLIAVQGVVYCKNCTYAGLDTLVGASPLQGATVQVKCNNTKKYELIGNTTSDKRGYFYLKGPKHVTTFGAHKCRAFLAQHGGACGKPTNLNGGVSGAFLILDAKSKYSDQSKSNKSSDVYVYDVGPFAYEPVKCLKY